MSNELFKNVEQKLLFQLAEPRKQISGNAENSAEKLVDMAIDSPVTKAILEKPGDNFNFTSKKGENEIGISGYVTQKGRCNVIKAHINDDNATATQYRAEGETTVITKVKKK